MGEKGGSPENTVLNPLHRVQFETHANATMEAFFSTLKTECFPDNQVFSSQAQARREIFEYIEVYYSNQRLHSALGYQTPCMYETQFKGVIDSEIDVAQAVDVATEDRALLRTHLERRCSLANGGCGRLRAAHRLRAGPRRSKPKAKNPRGSGDRVTRSFDNRPKKP